MTRRIFLSLALLAVAAAGCSADGGVPDADSGSRGNSDVTIRSGDSSPYVPEGGSKESGSQPGQDGTGEIPPVCKEGSRSCVSPKEVAECQLGNWVVVTICPDTHFCAGGTCVKAEECTPGEISGCYSLTALNQCNEAGTGLVPVDCPEGETCANGVCGLYDCLPGKAICVDSNTLQHCNENGEWDDPEACPEGLLCVGGKCLSECLSDPKWNNSYIGCEYWTVDLDNYHDPMTMVKPDEAPHGVILGNPGAAPATVTFTSFASDVDFDVQPVTIDPGAVAVVEMPRMDIDGQVITDRSVRINSNRPVVAYQFNPLDFHGTYSDDSSLLIPAEMLGKEYYVVTLGTSPLEAMPIIPAASQHGYFTVLAVEAGVTNLSVRVTAIADKPDAPEGEYLTPGGYHDFVLEQGQAINFQGDGTQLLVNNDLTGSHIIADRKVAVFAGHEEAVVQDMESAGGEDCCCAEHIEEQFFPVDTWTSEYLCVKAKPRGANDSDLWRVVAGTGNVQLTTDPPIDGIHGETLSSKGDWVGTYTKESFRLTATGPVMAAQILSSGTCLDEGVGDPAMVLAVATEQYRTNYVFAAPKDYAHAYIGVARQAGAPVTLDGTALPDGEFQAVAAGTHEVGYVEVEDGPHEVESDQPFGLYQYGWDGPSSYGNPGGLNLIKQQ